MHKRDRLAKYQREFPVIDYAHEYDIDPEKREIYLFGREEFIYSVDTETGHEEPGVDYTMANRFIRNLRILQGVSDDSILIHMKTNGGDWYEGMAIYQAICACPNQVTILNYTHARSMSSIILQAADMRVMLPYSVFMYHDGTQSTDGTVKQFWSEAEQLRIADKVMMEIYLDQAVGAPAWNGMSRARIKSFMRTQMDKKEDVYLTAEETVARGFADFVFGEDGKYDWNKLRG